MFWTNIVTKKESNGQNSSNSSATKTASNETSSLSPSKSPDLSGYLVLDDWKIKLKLPSNSGEVLYFAETDKTSTQFEPGYYAFTTKEVDALGDYCSKSTANNSPVVYLGTLVRSKKQVVSDYGPSPLNNNNPINEYYYYANTAQATCSEKGGDLQVKGLAVIKELLNAVTPL